MHRFLVLLVFTVKLSWAQTPADLVRDVRENTVSATAFIKAIKAHTAEKAQNGYGVSLVESAGLMGHKKIWQRVLYSRRDQAQDSVIYTEVFVNAVYKEDKLRYVQVTEHYDRDYAGHYETRELMKYVDSSYARQILLPYNEKHETNFGWKDLFEDNLRYFEFFGDVVAVEYYDRPDGSGRDSVFSGGKSGCKVNPIATIGKVLNEENLQNLYTSIYRTFKTQTSPR